MNQRLKDTTSKSFIESHPQANVYIIIGENPLPPPLSGFSSSEIPIKIASLPVKWLPSNNTECIVAHLIIVQNHQ